MGFNPVIGRPSCNGGTKLLVEVVCGRQPSEVMIIADNDEEGQRGAHSLASIIAVYSALVRVIQPPKHIKDARAWLQAGGKREDVEKRIAAASVHRMTMTTRKVR